MYTNMNINNQRFTIRFCNIAQYFGFTKVGGFEKLLLQMHSKNPNAKIYFAYGQVSITRLLDEIDAFKKVIINNQIP